MKTLTNHGKEMVFLKPIEKLIGIRSLGSKGRKHHAQLSPNFNDIAGTRPKDHSPRRT